jgi:hypothetical protein
VIPGTLDEETWEKKAYEQQAPYRGNQGDTPLLADDEK